MRKKKSKFIAVCAMLISVFLFSSTAMAGTVYTHQYFNYQLEGQSVTITNYFGKEETVTVPNMIAGYPVSKIATGAFSGNEHVKHVNLPDTIMEVQSGAIGGGTGVTYNSNTDSPQHSIPSGVPNQEKEPESVGSEVVTDGEKADNTGKDEFVESGVTVTEEELEADLKELEELEEEGIISNETSSNKGNVDDSKTMSENGYLIPVLIAVLACGIGVIIIKKKKSNN